MGKRSLDRPLPNYYVSGRREAVVCLGDHFPALERLERNLANLARDPHLLAYRGKTVIEEIKCTRYQKSSKIIPGQKRPRRSGDRIWWRRKPSWIFESRGAYLLRCRLQTVWRISIPSNDYYECRWLNNNWMFFVHNAPRTGWILGTCWRVPYDWSLTSSRALN